MMLRSCIVCYDSNLNIKIGVFILFDERHGTFLFDFWVCRLNNLGIQTCIYSNIENLSEIEEIE